MVLQGYVVFLPRLVVCPMGRDFVTVMISKIRHRRVENYFFRLFEVNPPSPSSFHVSDSAEIGIVSVESIQKDR